MDPPDHERLRRLVSRVFTPKAVADLEPMVRGLITKYLDPLVGEPSFDLTADFAGPFPVEVICVILGVPEADRQQIRHWVDDMLHREPGDPKPDAGRGWKPGSTRSSTCWSWRAEKRRNPTPDMLSGLVEAGLSDEEIAGFGVLVAGAGSETVTKLVGSGVVLFDRNPGEWEKVLADPAGALPGAIEEILRYWAPSQYQGRRSTTASEWHGVTIPEDEPVLLLTGAANRDPRAYEDPDRFDIGRALKLSVGFGHGIHTCLGAALARLESRIAFEEIAKRWPGTRSTRTASAGPDGQRRRLQQRPRHHPLGAPASALRAPLRPTRRSSRFGQRDTPRADLASLPTFSGGRGFSSRGCSCSPGWCRRRW